MKNKILAVVGTNNSESLVLKYKPKLKYTQYEYHTIIGTDGIFIDAYFYDCPSKGFKAFCGREFEIKLENGNIVKCNGQWWDGLTDYAKKNVFKKEPIIYKVANGTI